MLKMKRSKIKRKIWYNNKIRIAKYLYIIKAIKTIQSKNNDDNQKKNKTKHETTLLIFII